MSYLLQTYVRCCGTSIESESFDKGVLLRSPPSFMPSWLCSFPHYFSMAPHPEIVFAFGVPCLPFCLPALAPRWGALLACPGHIWSHKKGWIYTLFALAYANSRQATAGGFIPFFLLLTFAYNSVQSQPLSWFGRSVNWPMYVS